MTLSKINKKVNSEPKKFFLKTYGCQMNFHDSALIESGLLKNGFDKAQSIAEADLVIFNTCSVRDHADHKILSEMGRLKKTYSGKITVLAGCFAKQVKLRKLKEGIGLRFSNKIGQNLSFDYCFGPEEILSIPDVLKNDNITNKNKNADANINANEDPSADISDNIYQNYHSAYDSENFETLKEYFYDKTPENSISTVKITEGCNNYCSYCIVPYVRGKERSIPFEIIYNTVKNQVSKGAKEILLLGQNVNSYISPESKEKNFRYLLNALSEISGLEKIKFLTSHPKDFTDELIETVCGNEKVSKEIHLPVQSGSDKILSAMNRGYTRKDYLTLVKKLKRLFPDISISTDIIVGFPGETDEDFQMTLSLIEEVKFDFIFGFKYSPRPLTKSFEIMDDVSLEVKKERLELVFDKYKEYKEKKNIKKKIDKKRG